MSVFTKSVLTLHQLRQVFELLVSGLDPLSSLLSKGGHGWTLTTFSSSDLCDL